MSKTIIDKVKALVFEDDKPKDEVKKVELMEVKTADGVILNVESNEVGSPITVVDAEGVETPASGDYSLEDGTVIKAEEGVITEIVVADVEEKEEEEMETEDKTKDLESKVSDLSSKLDEVLAKFKTLDESFTALKEEPAEEEIKLSKKEIKLSAKETALSGLSKYRN